MKDNNEKGISISWIAFLVVIMVAGNLRSPITSVSPVLSEIKKSLNLDNFQGSLLTSIPLMVFAGCSILVSKFSSKINIRLALAFSLIILILGLYIRINGDIFSLYIGSFIVGLGICIGNVIMPSYIKDIFRKNIGLTTGIFTVSMNLIAALASGLSINIGRWTNMGWKGSLGIWIIWAFISLIIVITDSITNKKHIKENKAYPTYEKFNILYSKQAWNISIFMGIQSLVFYSLAALLPNILLEYGMDKTDAGWVFSTIQLAMLPVMLICPIIATKIKDHTIMVYSVGILMFTGVALLTFFKANYVYWAAVLIGTSVGTSFSLVLIFFSVRTKSLLVTTKISGMAQSAGYLIASVGPPIFSKLHQWDVSWHYSFYFLLLNVIIMSYFGKKAAQPKFIEDC